MFRKSTNTTGLPATKTPAKKTVPSVLSSDVNILGNIISDGMLDFDGKIDGNIRCASLVVRHSGRISGEVHADTVHVYGQVKGLIKAKQVYLYATSYIDGVIMHEMLSVEDGATVDGKFKRMNKTLPASAAAPLPSNDMPMAEEEESDATASGTPRLLDNIRLIAG